MADAHGARFESDPKAGDTLQNTSRNEMDEIQPLLSWWFKLGELAILRWLTGLSSINFPFPI